MGTDTDRMLLDGGYVWYNGERYKLNGLLEPNQLPQISFGELPQAEDNPYVRRYLGDFATNWRSYASVDAPFDFAGWYRDTLDRMSLCADAKPIGMWELEDAEKIQEDPMEDVFPEDIYKICFEDKEEHGNAKTA